MTRRGPGAALLLVALMATGCGTTYFRNRHADFLDAFPASVAWGSGLGISVQATAFAQVGVSIAPTQARRAGYDDRTYYGYWREYQAAFPWTFGLNSRTGVPADRGDRFWLFDSIPVVYRWQEMRDAPTPEGDHSWQLPPGIQSKGRHPPTVRSSFGAFGVPAQRREVRFRNLADDLGDGRGLDAFTPPDRSTIWEVDGHGRDLHPAWDLFELDVFVLLVGARVGVRPVEAADFVIGIVGIDILGDDMPHPETFEPVAP